MGALAAPVDVDKRGALIIKYGTATTEVIITEYSTVWVDEPTTTPVAAFYEAPATTSVAPVVVPTTSLTPVAVAQVVANTPVAPAPQPTTSTPAPAPAPATSSVVQAAVAAPVAAVSSPVVQAAAAPAPAAVQSVASVASVAAPVAAVSTPASSSSSSSGSWPYTGDITYYDVSVGLSSCGLQGSNSQDLVAIAPGIMANGANPNANPKCGQKIEISYQGNTHVATVFDTCPGCSGGSIDLTEGLFKKVAPNGDGRVSGVSWRFM